jgi:hypothetical protein
VVQTDGAPKIIFGEALAFYELLQRDNELLVVYHNLTSQKNVLGHWTGIWSQDISVLPVKNITGKIGIWDRPRNGPYSWMIRKHPGLAMLSAAETEKTQENEGSEDMDNGEDD